MQAIRDENHVTNLLMESSTTPGLTLNVKGDELTGRLLVDNSSGTGGTVTTVSVVTANGFAGSVANPTTTPAITIATTVTGLLKGDGTAISVASSSTDYAAVAFKTISVSGQSDVVADSPIDTLTLVGSGITITTNAGTDTITFTASAASLIVGTTTISSGTTTRVLFDNGGVLGEYVISGSGNVAMTTSPSFTTPSLGVATATSVNGLIITTTTGTLTIASGKVVTVSNTLTFTGTDSSSVAFGTGGTVLYTSSTIPLTVGTTTITSGTNTRILYNNSGVLGEYTLTGTGTVVVMATSPTFSTGLTTPQVLATANDSGALGASGTAFSDLFLASGAVINFAAGNYTITHSSGLLTTNGNLSLTTSGVLTTGTIELGAASDTTISRVSSGVIAVEGATVATLTATQTFTGQNKFNNFIDVNQAVTVTSNAGTVPVTFRLNTFTNSSAATMAITLATASAMDGQMTIVRIYDFSGVTQTIGWTNTENSTVSVPTTSNGSTTLPLTVGFMFNSGTSKWRCIASA